jgi:hypothetical protein
MRRETGILVGSILTAACLMGCAVGIALLVIAHRMPAHTDEARATELTIQYEQNYMGTPVEQDAIEQKIAALRTSKWKLYNAGLPICLTTLLLLIAILRFKLWDVRMVRSATTPLTRLRLLGLASGAWLALFPAILLQLEDEYGQDDLTPTMGAGPGAFLYLWLAFVMIAWIVIVLAGRFIVLRKTLMPARLLLWNNNGPRRTLIWTAVYGLFGGILVILIALSVRAFPWGLPSLIVGLYVVASSRAALLNHSQNPTGGLIAGDELSDDSYRSTTT